MIAINYRALQKRRATILKRKEAFRQARLKQIFIPAIVDATALTAGNCVRII